MILTLKEALQWCSKHIVEWPTREPSIYPDGWMWANREPSIYPDGWMWANRNGEWVLHNFEGVVISRFEYLRHKCDAAFRPINNRSVTVTIYPKSQHQPCGKSFHELMKELNNA